MNRLTQSPTRGRHQERSGFTLIELLVVVSIIALLIGILLPTLGEARRQAGIAACVATIRSNGQGTAAFSADNQDRLPHAPEGQNFGNQNNGGPGRPALRFATNLTGPVNGWLFTQQERPNGIQYQTTVNAVRARDVGVEAFWFIAFGNYMTEATGDAMLQEPFVSPTDRGRKNEWNRYRNTPRERRGIDADLATPSYWYALPALFETRWFLRNGPLDTSGGGAGGGGGAGPTWQDSRTFHRNASVAFPSTKVAFYQHNSSHDRGAAYWFERGGSLRNGPATSLAMFDGSAKSVTPYRDNQVIQPNDVNTSVSNQDAGPISTGFPFQTLGPNTGFYGTPTRWRGSYYQFFRFTFGGLGGRDLP